MDLSIQDLGSLGELIAAIATIATLFYLALQLRMNTKVVRATSSANTQDSLAVINELVASNPKLAHLFAKLLDGATQDQFEPADFVAITCALRANMQRFESMFFRYEAGLLDADVWAVRRTWMGGFIRNPGVADWWRAERNSYLFTQRFIDEIESEQVITIGRGGQRNQGEGD